MRRSFAMGLDFFPGKQAMPVTACILSDIFDHFSMNAFVVYLDWVASRRMPALPRVVVV